MGRVRFVLTLLGNLLLDNLLLGSPLLGSPLLGSFIIIIITILIIKIYLSSNILFIRFIIFPVVRLIIILLFNFIYSIFIIFNIIISVLNRRYICVVIGSFCVLNSLIGEVLSVTFVPNVNSLSISSLIIIMIKSY